MELHIREATTTDYEALCMLFDEGDALHREHLPHVFRKPEGPVRVLVNGIDNIIGQAVSLPRISLVKVKFDALFIQYIDSPSPGANP